jgi:sialate O-acetylesterase
VIVITDLGEENDIHPQRKEPVGQRLALAARALAYNEPVEYSGPTLKDYKIEGDQVILSFDHIDGGLEAKGDGLNGFQVCGDDRQFKPAKAEIKGDKVVVRSDEVNKPIAVRYGWVNFAKPELNFFNKKGLPAVPFRTDEFPLTTATKK